MAALTCLTIITTTDERRGAGGRKKRTLTTPRHATNSSHSPALPIPPPQAQTRFVTKLLITNESAKRRGFRGRTLAEEDSSDSG